MIRYWIRTDGWAWGPFASPAAAGKGWPRGVHARLYVEDTGPDGPTGRGVPPVLSRDREAVDQAHRAMHEARAPLRGAGVGYLRGG